MLAKPDPSTFQILPWRGEGPSHGADVLRHRDARRLPVVRRPALRAQAHPEQGGRQGLHLLHPPRDRVLPLQGHPGAGRRAGAGRPQRLLRPHRAVAWARTSAARRSRCSSRWASRWSSATTRAARASRRSTCATPTRCRTADNIMTFRTVIREVALSQGIWASFMPKPFTTHPGSGMHTHVSLFEGDRNAFFEAGAEYQLSKTGRAVHRRHPARTPARSPCVTNQWVNSYKRLIGGGEAPSYICWGHNNRSAMIRVPMYKPNKGQSTRDRAAHHRRRVQPLPRVRRHARRRHEGHRGGLRAARARPRTTSGRSPSASARASASTRCRRACTTPSASPRSSELLAETLGEHVFDFFLRNKRAEWEEYRGQVSAFERDRMLPVI